MFVTYIIVLFLDLFGVPACSSGRDPLPPRARRLGLGLGLGLRLGAVNFACRRGPCSTCSPGVHLCSTQRLRPHEMPRAVLVFPQGHRTLQLYGKTNVLLGRALLGQNWRRGGPGLVQGVIPPSPFSGPANSVANSTVRSLSPLTSEQRRGCVQAGWRALETFDKIRLLGFTCLKRLATLIFLELFRSLFCLTPTI